MAHRRFALIVVAGSVLLFAGTMAANVVLDPEAVFGTGLFPPSANRNERVERLQAYKRDASSVDGLLFSSSRGVYLDHDMLAQKMGVSHLLSLSVSYGMITDHLPILSYILRDKAARGQKLKAALLLLDADFFGTPPWTDSNINSFLPPELSGESALRYWWRYLTVFQYRLWRDVVRASLNPGRGQAGASGSNEAPVMAPPSRSPTLTMSEDYRRHWNSNRPDFDRQYKKLEEFVGLCRDNGVRLTVAISPLIRQHLDLYEPGMLDALIARLSGVVALWDFSSSSAIADHREYWLDISHFDRDVGTMMIGRIFGNDRIALAIPADFGRLRTSRQN